MNKIYITLPISQNDTASLKLMDGTCIGLNSNKNDTAYAKIIFIDTNGSYRAPNMAGYDLFFFLVVITTTHFSVYLLLLLSLFSH